MAATKLNIRSRAPAVVVALLLATFLLLAATVVNASRPLKVSSEGSGAQHTVVSPPAGHIIETVVVGTADAEQDGGAAAGHRLMNVDMLGGIKNSGPSPGVGH